MIFTDHHIYFDCTQSIGEKLGAVYVESKKLYRLPLNLEALRELYPYHKTTEIVERGQRLKIIHDELQHIKKHLRDAPGDGNLRPYQRVDIQFLQQLDHAGIFNEQRTGKTATVLKLVEAEQFKRILIVCPASLKENWKEEVEKWTGQTAIVVGGSATKRKKLYKDAKAAFLIISYETLRNDVKDVPKKYDCMIVDEAHRIRNHKTQSAKAVKLIGKGAKKRIALTGTPAVNHAADVYGILTFLFPEQYKSYWQFVERYFKVNDGFFGKKIGGFIREKEFNYLLDSMSTQRKRRDVMKWLPKVERQTIRVEMDPKQEKAYEQMKTTFEVEQDGQLLVDAPSPLAQLTRLRQITLDPKLLGIDAGSSKEKFLLDWLQDNPNTPTIIFSTLTSYLRTIATRLKTKCTVFGDMATADKQKNVRDFQKGKSNILLANIISGGTGFTIDRAEVIIFLDRSFVPVENEQAADRFIPTIEADNHKSRTIIDLVAKDTVDETILKLLKDKKNIIQHVNDYGVKSLL